MAAQEDYDEYPEQTTTGEPILEISTAAPAGQSNRYHRCIY